MKTSAKKNAVKGQTDRFVERQSLTLAERQIESDRKMERQAEREIDRQIVG